jgi:hypothetical protein
MNKPLLSLEEFDVDSFSSPSSLRLGRSKARETLPLLRNQRVVKNEQTVEEGLTSMVLPLGQ